VSLNHVKNQDFGGLGPLSKEDNRRMMLEKAMKEHEYKESALLEILHKAQGIYGYLDKELLMDISQSLNLPPSHVFGVATFYSFFKLKSPSQHIVKPKSCRLLTAANIAVLLLFMRNRLGTWILLFGNVLNPFILVLRVLVCHINHVITKSF
jgi:hypothetical protein